MGEGLRQRLWIALVSLLAVAMLVACDDQSPTETAENVINTPASTSVATLAPPAPTQAPTPTRPVGFGPGAYQVGKDIQPGTYAGKAGTGALDSCSWERLSGVSGEFSDFIAIENSSGQFYVEILDIDKYFRTGCVVELVK